MSIPNTPANLKSYIASLPSFPTNKTTAVRYGYTDSKDLPIVVIGDCKITPDQWTTQGPAVWISEFSVNCFAKSNADAFTLATDVDALFSQQHITGNTSLCELTSLVVVQEDYYRFHAQLNYKLTEDA